MNEHDDVICQVRESFSGLRMEMPVENVFAAGRVRRRRRRRRLSGLTAATAVTAGAAAAMTLSLGGPVPARSGNPPSNPPVVSPGSVRLAAFSVTSGPGDNTTLILRKGEQLDPSALREDLAQHGIPAMVTVGTFCRSRPAGSASFDQVLHPSTVADGSDVLVIDGSAIPSGTELSIGYFGGSVRIGFIRDGASLSCSSSYRQPAVRITPTGTPIRG